MTASRPVYDRSRGDSRWHARSMSLLTLDEVMLRVREAIELCLEIEGVPGQDLEFVGIQRVTVAA